MGFSSARSTRAKRQGNHVLYDAKDFIETICTRLDTSGRVFKPVSDGFDGGRLVVDKILNDKEEMWSAEVKKKRKQMELTKSGKVLNKVGMQTRLSASEVT